MFSAVTGIKATPVDLLLAGERIWNIQKAFNIREGASRKDDRLPERFLRGPVDLRAGTFPPVKENEVSTLIDEYYEAHGWEKETGKPTVEKLMALGLEAVAGDLQYY